MVKTVEYLKLFYINMIHIICTADMLNKLKKKLKYILPSVPLAPAPLLTRWGTWLVAAFFILNHFDGLKVLEKLENHSAIRIEKCTDLFAQVLVQNNLIFLKLHYFVFFQAIKNLEISNLPLVKLVKIVQNVI